MRHENLVSAKLRRAAVLLASCMAPLWANAVDLPTPAPLGDPATRIFRQVGPNGSVIYSDRPIGNAALDATLTIDRPIPGNGWTTRPGKGAVIPPQDNPTPVARVAAFPDPDRPRTLDDANLEVMRAEMLLEDARQRFDRSRTGTVQAGSAADADPAGTQGTVLQEAVETAERNLKRAVSERNALRNAQITGRPAAAPRGRDADTVARSYQRLRD